MSHVDLLSINSVAAKLGLSVHQLRRWELMFGLEIKRGRGQQRQYRSEDLTVLERIKELVEQGWPTSQIRPQLEAEGLITPKLIGLPQAPGNPEVLMESMIGFRNFCERRFIEISKQIDELRQLMISMTLKQELQGERLSPWQPLREEYLPPIKERPMEEITLGPVGAQIAAVSAALPLDDLEDGDFPPVVPQQVSGEPLLQQVTDQNYLTVLGKALDLVGWSDAQADEYSMKNFGVSVWIDLGRSQAEVFVDHLKSLMVEQAIQDATA
jgi:DNA-binding transcriptional MerR regulator